MFRFGRKKQDKLLAEINVMRQMMIDCGVKKGFNSKDTIRISQDLDKLLNKYQCFMNKSSKANSKLNFGIKKIVNF